MKELKDFSRKGDFCGQPLVGIFDPVVEDSTHRSSYFGLPLEGSWPYGVLRTESGKEYALMRKIIGQTTTYLMIQTTGEGGLRMDPRTFSLCQHGGRVLRRMKGQYDEYFGVEGPGDRPGFKLRMGYEDFIWEEKGVLRLQGKRTLPGWHVYTPWREGDGNGQQGGLYYTSVCYAADGEIFGEKASGFFVLDQSYLPQGVDWNDMENRIWGYYQQAWAVWANEYEDGAMEWGHFSFGADRFRFGTVINQDGMIVDSHQVELKMEWADNGYIRRLVYDFGGNDQWEFIAAPNGHFVEFSEWVKIWRGHSGVVQRVGETRKIVRRMGWQEIFPERLKA